jgi:HSP20 family protein
MNALTRSERFDDLFADFFRRYSPPAAWSGNGAGEIRIDVTENDKAYEVRAEMPAVKKEDIRVNVDGSFVSIAAEVKQEKEEKTARSLLRETYRGSVSRGFSLPAEIDAKAVSAKLEDGVLMLQLPKREGAGARSIAVQ